jgi:acyl-CoA hydrolase
MPLPAKPPSESFSEMVQFVLPNDANPLGFILGGTVMHLIDIAGAIVANRHTRSQVVTASVDDLQFLHPIRVGDMILLRAWVNQVFRTSMEVEVEVCSEEALTGRRQLTSRAYLTFVAVDNAGQPVEVPPLELTTDDERQRATAATLRRNERLNRKKAASISLSDRRG